MKGDAGVEPATPHRVTAYVCPRIGGVGRLIGTFGI